MYDFVPQVLGALVLLGVVDPSPEPNDWDADSPGVATSQNHFGFHTGPAPNFMLTVAERLLDEIGDSAWLLHAQQQFLLGTDADQWCHVLTSHGVEQALAITSPVSADSVAADARWSAKREKHSFLRNFWESTFAKLELTVPASAAPALLGAMDHPEEVCTLGAAP